MNLSRFDLCLSLLLTALVLSGCGGESENPIEARLRQEGYTAETLVSELETRLAMLEQSGGRGMSEAARSGPESPNEDGRDSGPGMARVSGPGDGPGGNPYTFEAIISDIREKIKFIQTSAGEDTDVRADVISAVESSNIPATMKEKVLEALK